MVVPGRRALLVVVDCGRGAAAVGWLEGIDARGHDPEVVVGGCAEHAVDYHACYLAGDGVLGHTELCCFGRVIWQEL